MLPIIIGIFFILGGLWGILHWMDSFLAFLKGFIPLVFLLGGIVSFISGVASFKVSGPGGKRKK